MRGRCLLLALALVAAFASDSWGQSKKQSPRNETQKSEQGTQPEHRGSPDQPLTVNVVPTAEQKADAEKKDADSKLKAVDHKKITRDQVAIGIVTFFIFVLQLAAFVAQACYMRRSYVEMRRTTHATIGAARAAQKSASAAAAQAKIAENALVQLERPYVFVFGVRRLDYDNPKFYVQYTVANYGKIPAIVDHVFAGFVSFNGSEMPLPLWKDDDHALSVNPIFESGEKRDAPREYIPDGMDTGVIHVIDGPENAFGFDQPADRISPEWNIPPDNNVFFRVVIRYHGPFSQGHETAAAWWCMTGSRQLVQRGGDEYNYNR